MLFAAQAFQCIAAGGARTIDTNCRFEGLFGTVIVAAVNKDLTVVVEGRGGQLGRQSPLRHRCLGSRSNVTKIIRGLRTPLVKKRKMPGGRGTNEAGFQIAGRPVDGLIHFGQTFIGQSALIPDCPGAGSVQKLQAAGIGVHHRIVREVSG